MALVKFDEQRQVIANKTFLSQDLCYMVYLVDIIHQIKWLQN